MSPPTEAWGLGFYTQPHLIQLLIGCKLQGAVGSEVRGTWHWVRLRFGGGEFPDSSSPKSLPGSACQLGDESSDLKLGLGDTPHVARSSQKRKWKYCQHLIPSRSCTAALGASHIRLHRVLTVILQEERY